MKMKPSPECPEEEVTPVMSWHFTQDDPKDVMNHGYEALEKMDAMLKELAGLRLENGLPADEELTVADDRVDGPEA